ncbi:DUF4139 domain-containing protein [bacterium]|nr:DUF4139 domain-containing protein [bacterium]
MAIRLLAITLLASCMLAISANWSTAMAKDAGKVEDLYITIYNGDLALVKEKRSFNLREGRQGFTLDNVSGRLNPSTVHLSFPEGVDFELLEQNFDYDLVSMDKMLEKFIGRPISLVTTNDDGTESSQQVTLLSTSGGRVMKDSEGQILLNPPGRVVLPAGSADELLLRPTLSWDLWSGQSGSQTGEISYLSGGLDWKADYVVMLNADDTAADIEGWVTLTNNSGTTFENATLKLVAGDVNRVRDELRRNMPMPAAAPMMSEAKPGGFQEESFFEYHLYDLQRPTTVRNNQQKQIGLLTATSVGTKKLFIFDGHYGGDVSVKVQFENSEENNMGMPLPKGVVRVFKADSKGQAQFVGEDRIDHTPKDEDVRLTIGNAFDIKGETVRKDYQDIGKGFTESWEITLKNHKESEDVVVTVPFRIGGDWSIMQSSIDYVKKDANTAEFSVPVPADGETKFTFQYRVVWR